MLFNAYSVLWCVIVSKSSVLSTDAVTESVSLVSYEVSVVCILIVILIMYYVVNRVNRKMLKYQLSHIDNDILIIDISYIIVTYKNTTITISITNLQYYY
jgi:hypothetical protein